MHGPCVAATRRTINSAYPHLEGDPDPPKLFLAPAKDGGAPPGEGSVGGAVASPPSRLAGGRRMGAGKGGQREGCLHAKCTKEALCGGTL